MVLRVVATGTPVLREVVADAIKATRIDQRTGIKELFGDQFRCAQDAIAGPQSQTSLHPVNPRMPWRFGYLGKKMLSHLPRYFELVVAP